MFDRKHFIDNLRKVDSITSFNEAAIALFHHQAKSNPVYRAFLSHLTVDVQAVKEVVDIPFMPIELFKTQKVITSDFTPEVIFESSGTTSDNTSKHYIKEVKLYLQNAIHIFKKFYGNPQEYIIMALLPSYLERQNSSLVFMVEELIKLSHDTLSGFYLNDYSKLIKSIQKAKKPVLLFGVSFALLDLAEQFDVSLHNTTIIETGGMKGRRKELTREELHEKIAQLAPKAIHSEYGMTELLSQAYTTGGLLFSLPNTMRFLVRELHDPFAVRNEGYGALNVIDLANVDSCAFIGTQDLAKVDKSGKAEILGRIDNSDIRGCNLLVLE